MAFAGGGKKGGPQSAINITPLVDVVLVLLIIFMVLTPVLFRAQIPLQLPKATQVEPSPSAENAVEVQVDRTGNVFIEGKPVPRDQLESAFKRSENVTFSGIGPSSRR